MRKNQPASITRQVRRSTRSITAVLVLPAVLGLVVMLIFANSYHGIIRRMDIAAKLQPTVKSSIAEELFSVAAGRVTFEQSGLEETISEVNQTLEQLQQESGGAGQLQLTVAQRTMSTLEQYVLQVRDGMAAGRPVAEMEAVVDEVRDVGTLVNDMLEDFLGAEIASAAETNQRLRWVLLITALTEAVLLLLALWSTHRATDRLSDSIHDAIRNLEQLVRRLAGGNLQERITGIEVEELDGLADQINIMADRLDTLIGQIREEQVNLAKSELRTLQAQINPHFLYNTLDTIIWQAESGKAEEVIQLTNSLSEFFRISLSAGADWITLAQELQHVRAYLSIQRTRYRDILTYEVDEPPADADGIYMVKLLLQPLVENALYHGIKARRGGGTIHVGIARAGDRMTFTVEDNGRGMTAEELERVRESLHSDVPAVQSETAGSGFGLRNVDMRIRLYYQQEEGLDIRSDANGTCVSFCVPCRTKEDIADDEGISG